MEVITIVKDEDIGEKSIKTENLKIRYAARGIVIREDGKIAVFYKKNKNEYKLPGGGIEEGELPEEAFKREILEETGCEVEILFKLGTTEEYRTMNNFKQISHVFVSKVLNDTKTLHVTEQEADEGAVLLWETPIKALELISNCYEDLIASKYSSIYNTKFVIIRDTRILEAYLNYMKKVKQDLINIHIDGQLELYISNKSIKDNYNIISSELIEDGFWNYVYLTNSNINLKEVWKSVEEDLKKLNRSPLIYITSEILNENLEKQIEQENMKKVYTDVWMIIDDISSFKKYESKIQFEVKKVDEYLKDRFILAVMKGFSGDNPEDPYEALSDGYRIALEGSFKENKSMHKVIHYLGTYNEEDISTATVIYKDNKAIIYNVTTNKKYQKNGVCKKMMFEILQDLKTVGINVVCVQTEKDFYTEKVYKNMGFREIMLGIGYDK